MENGEKHDLQHGPRKGINFHDWLSLSLSSGFSSTQKEWERESERKKERAGIEGREIECVHSNICKYLNQRDRAIWKPVIEMIEMHKNALQGIENFGCQVCGKKYHLGLRMPVRIDCNHIICYECARIVSNCRICRANITTKRHMPIERLYTMPKCFNCDAIGGSIDIHNLPFHNLCDCIICGRCIKTNNTCNECTFTRLIIGEKYPVLNKKALSSLIYLDLNITCEGCYRNPAEYCNYTNFLALCGYCNNGHQSVISLKDYFSLDSFLLRYSEIEQLSQDNQPLSYYYYPSLPINYKRRIIAKLFNNSLSIGSYPYLMIKTFRRFNLLYPTIKNDLRCYRVSDGNINFTIDTDKAIKVLGIIIAGKITYESCNVRIWYSSVTGTVKEITSQIDSKENIILFEDIQGSNYFSAFISYPLGSELFAGKISTNKLLNHDGINFSQSDCAVKGHEFYGPILGILYSDAFN